MMEGEGLMGEHVLEIGAQQSAVYELVFSPRTLVRVIPLCTCLMYVCVCVSVCSA